MLMQLLLHIITLQEMSTPVVQSKYTRMLVDASKLPDVKVNDHVIIEGRDDF